MCVAAPGRVDWGRRNDTVLQAAASVAVSLFTIFIMARF
jgi:hypothetical protein